MATAPVKSQPLHNFNLPSYLKWGGGKSNSAAGSNRLRRAMSSSPTADEKDVNNQKQAAEREQKNNNNSEAESEKNESEPEFRSSRVGSRSARTHRQNFGSCSITTAHKQTPERENRNDEGDEGKPWNLRPRRGLNLQDMVGGSTSAVLAMPASVRERDKERENEPKSMRLRGLAVEGEERREKRKLWIALSKEEIEEDVYAMTGGRPSRRPKKRAKNVQKQLDTVFPGLWLVGMTADAYRIAEAPAKR